MSGWEYHSAKIWGKFSGRENARLKFWGNLADWLIWRISCEMHFESELQTVWSAYCKCFKNLNKWNTLLHVLFEPSTTDSQTRSGRIIAINRSNHPKQSESPLKKNWRCYRCKRWFLQRKIYWLERSDKEDDCHNFFLSQISSNEFWHI